MRQSFWILNSSLLLILIATIIYAIFTRTKLPPRQSIEPSITEIEKKPVEKLNFETIYTNDLFNTTQESKPIIKPEIEKETKIPSPPSPVQIVIPETVSPEFFEPLPLTLTGIFVQYNESKNKAIIMDNKTQNQINYKVGDEIEDAQIVRILKNKVILIRSNGQQEILYLNQEDAKLDDPMEKAKNIKNIAKKVSDELYIIDPDRFINYVTNLGELIELFDLVTAYKQGRSIGIRIGKLEADSLGTQMGLTTDDIIQKIDDLPIISTNDRFKIYKKIISAKKNDIIKLELLRNNNTIDINYKLGKIEQIKEPSSKSKTQIEKVYEDKIEANKIKILKEKHKFAPTLEELKLRERQNMFKKKPKRV